MSNPEGSENLLSDEYRFSDQEVMLKVLGPRCRNLGVLEREFGVTMGQRGLSVLLKGPPKHVVASLKLCLPGNNPIIPWHGSQGQQRPGQECALACFSLRTLTPCPSHDMILMSWLLADRYSKLCQMPDGLELLSGFRRLLSTGVQVGLLAEEAS